MVTCVTGKGESMARIWADVENYFAFCVCVCACVCVFMCMCVCACVCVCVCVWGECIDMASLIDCLPAMCRFHLVVCVS